MEEIIRCKDCKFWDRENILLSFIHPKAKCSEFGGRYLGEDGFCCFAVEINILK